jgi:mono/diheme cytochrome c family protein
MDQRALLTSSSARFSLQQAPRHRLKKRMIGEESMRKAVLFFLFAIFATPSLASNAGEEIYAENCASCHGERLRPTGSAPDLKLLGADERAKFDMMVSQGKGQMPAWEGILSDDERNAIWDYIRSRAR